MTHRFPRYEWTPCSEPPSEFRRVIAWHRARKSSRFFVALIGWWNGEEWRTYEQAGATYASALIYQPTLWRDVEAPTKP